MLNLEIYRKMLLKCYGLNVLTWLKVQNHVQSLAVMRHLLIQTCQVKLVLYVVFINLLHTI